MLHFSVNEAALQCTIVCRSLSRFCDINDAWLITQKRDQSFVNCQGCRSLEHLEIRAPTHARLFALSTCEENQRLQWRLHSLYRDSFAAGRKSFAKYDYRGSISAAWSLFTVARFSDLISLQTSRNSIGRSCQVDCGLIKVCPDVSVFLK